MTHIAFFGLGHMGSPMAANLLKAGHSLKVYDPVTENTAAAAELGAQQAGALGLVPARLDVEPQRAQVFGVAAQLGLLGAGGGGAAPAVHPKCPARR